MHGRNGSLLAFRPTRRTHQAPGVEAGPPGNGDGPTTNGSGIRRPAADRSAMAGEARVDCPRCRLPIHVQSLQWQPVDDGPRHSPEDGARRLLEEQYEAIREGDREYRTVIHDLERRLLAEALEESDGVMKDAARLLGLKYTTFVAKAHRLGLAGEEA